MLRGAIDFAAPDRVSGWIFSRAVPVEGLLLQAFVDGLCVGEGLVGLYREDIKTAGLGDGRCGFSLAITLSDPSDTERVYVRLAESDFLLKQPTVTVAGKAAQSRSASARICWDSVSIEWMRQREALEQHELDLLTALVRFGVYDRSLKQTKRGGAAVAKEPVSADKQAAAVFNLLSVGDVTLHCQTIGDDEALSQLCLQATQSACYAALHADRATQLLVMEGSHENQEDRRTRPTDWVGAVQYALGPDRLVIVDLRCAMKLNPQPVSPVITTWIVSSQ